MNHKLLLEKISLLNHQTKAYADELKQLAKEQSNNLDISALLGYFTFSISTTNDENEKNIILGDFQIKNLTTKSIKDLYLCIKIDATDDYNFSGKFRTNTLNNDRTTSTSYWERFTSQNEKREDHEHWFQLSDEKQLLPLETISFSDFQINWKNESFYSCSIQGFIYTDSEKEGITSLNSINVSTKG